MKVRKRLNSNPGPQLSDRIVSIHLVRTIVRGKENKPIEFGPRMHMMQVGGINIIEHYSDKNINECRRLELSTFKHREVFRHCNQLAADRIYATNNNRTFVSKKQISTNSVSKGRSYKRESIK